MLLTIFNKLTQDNMNKQQALQQLDNAQLLWDNGGTGAMISEIFLPVYDFIQADTDNFKGFWQRNYFSNNPTENVATLTKFAFMVLAFT